MENNNSYCEHCETENSTTTYETYMMGTKKLCDECLAYIKRTDAIIKYEDKNIRSNVWNT